MRPSLSKWMVVMGFLAAILMAGGIWFLLDARKRSAAFAAWETATPLNHPVDFSKPGQYEIEFNQTCSSAHGEVVALRMPPELMEIMTPARLLSGLAATIEIRSQSEDHVVASATAETLWDNQTLDGAIPIFSLAPFRKGLYVASIAVTEGAPELAGHEQILEARYLLCGLEALPAEIAKWFGSALLITGLAAAAAPVLVLATRKTPASAPGPDIYTPHE